MLSNKDHTRIVLIVDDEEAICTITQLMLEKAGFHVLTAPDGMEAIQILTELKGQVDCILLDHSMPNMNGEETLEVMKKMFPGISVVMMSGYSMQDVSMNYLEKDVAGFIQKPYTQATLVRAIADAIKEK